MKWYPVISRKQACSVLFGLFVFVACLPQYAAASVNGQTSPMLRQMEFAVRIIQPVTPLDVQLKGALVNPFLFPAAIEKRIKKLAALPGAPDVGPSVPSLQPVDASKQLNKKLKTHERLRLLAAAKTEAQKKFEQHQQMSMWHQIFGYTTLALLAATVVIGQINALDFLDGRLSPQGMLWTHRLLSIGTSATYLSAGVLGWIFALTKKVKKKMSGDDDDDDDDDDDKKSGGFDSSKWHGILAWIHGIGMLGLVAGGVMNAHLIPSDTIGKTAFTVSHLAVGYITLAALATAMVMINFF